MFHRGLVFLAFLFNGAFFLNAQDEALISGSENGTNLNVLYRSDKTGKIYADTRGYGILFRQTKHVNAKTRSFYEIDIQSLKHPKEIRTIGDAQNRRRFVYGKLNTVFLLRGGLGLQNVIFKKGDMKAVEVRYSYSFGPVVAFAKPYYVQISTTASSQAPNFIKFDDSDFVADTPNVIGRAAYSYGLGEMKLYPGLCGKFNLSFEYAPYTNLIRAIETGVSVDYFPKALPLMARNPSENVIITLHVGFVFGRKKF
ncbi:MAG: hypothetical protein PSX36_07835 [bacterium]|nr:hypothetical protein [bacterium]